MTYATLADIDARYPGELALVGPRVDGELDEAAVALALSFADTVIDRALAQAGWSVPVLGGAPSGVRDLAVDLALYRVMPAVLAGTAAFNDRRQRYVDALETLQQIARGALSPVWVGGLSAALPTSLAGANLRLFGPGIL
jgi:phage gp36-like protein